MKINHNLAISDSGFLFNPGTGESFTANPMAAKIIGLLKEGKTEAQVIEHITGQYAIDKNTFEKDLHEFNGMLRMHQLLEKDE